MTADFPPTGPDDPKIEVQVVRAIRDVLAFERIARGPEADADLVVSRLSSENWNVRPHPSRPSLARVVANPPRPRTVREWLKINAPAVYLELLDRERAGIRPEEYL